VVVEKHRHEGVFIARGKEDALVTKNMVPGESVYGEKRISTEARSAACARSLARADDALCCGACCGCAAAGCCCCFAPPSPPVSSRCASRPGGDPGARSATRAHLRCARRRRLSDEGLGPAPLTLPPLSFSRAQGEGEGAPKVEYRVWNPFRSKIAAGILVRSHTRKNTHTRTHTLL
jgi:hypothetical protein